MPIKYADKIIKEIKERGPIKIPDNCATGEEFEKYLREGVSHMEIQIIKDRYHYRYDNCPHCNSELKIVKDSIDYRYSMGIYIVEITCPCCNEDFILCK